MTRRLWMVVSLLAAAAATWMYLGSGPDTLLWAWSRIMAPVAVLPAAVPATRLADALLVGLAVAYLVGFVPLTIASWLQGAHLASIARAAAGAAAAGADEVATARLAMLRTEAERPSPWQLLLQFDLVGVDSAPGAASQRRVSSERAAIIGDLVAHQSGASLFRGLAWMCLCLGMFALVAQTISNLLGTDLLQRPSKGLELAATRGLLSAVTAIVVAALIDLGARLAAAAIRYRAEMLGRRLDRLARSRRGHGDWDREPVLTAEPISAMSISTPSSRDEVVERTAALIERSEQQISHRVDEALQAVTGKAIRPLLQEISGALAVLTHQADRMAESLDRRLAEHREDARRLAESAAAAREEITRQTAAMLERSQQQMAESLERALQTLADRTMRPLLEELSGTLTVLTSKVGTVEGVNDRDHADPQEDARRIAEATAAAHEETVKQTAALIERSQQQVAQSIDRTVRHLVDDTLRPMLQELSGLLTVAVERTGTIGEALDRRLSQQHEETQRIAELAAAARDEIAQQIAATFERQDQQLANRVDGALERLTGATVRPMLQEVSRLLEVLSSQAGALVGTLDRRLSEQQEDGRRFAEAVTAGNRDLATLLNDLSDAMKRSAATMEERLDRLIAAQERSIPAPEDSRPTSMPPAVAGSEQSGQDVLAMLSRFLKETGGTGATPSAPRQNGQEGSASWSDRLAELRHSFADLTRDLPALRPDGLK